MATVQYNNIPVTRSNEALDTLTPVSCKHARQLERNVDLALISMRTTNLKCSAVRPSAKLMRTLHCLDREVHSVKGIYKRV